jgi:hypothetical protein
MSFDSIQGKLGMPGEKLPCKSNSKYKLRATVGQFSLRPRGNYDGITNEPGIFSSSMASNASFAFAISAK